MRRWPKLVLWNPSFPLVQRSHDSPLLGHGRTLLKLVMLCNFKLNHWKQHLSNISTCIEQVFSQVEGKLALKLHFYGESWTLHPLHLSISDNSEHGSRNQDHTQSSYRKYQIVRNHDKKEQYIFFENMTKFSSDQQDFQHLSWWNRVFFGPF